jgi:hypothetical protein
MDTRKLAIGQDVCIFSGVYELGGKVVEVTPAGVEVRTVRGPYVPEGALYCFDTNDEGCDGRSTYECGRGIWTTNQSNEISASLLVAVWALRL